MNILRLLWQIARRWGELPDYQVIEAERENEQAWANLYQARALEFAAQRDDVADALLHCDKRLAQYEAVIEEAAAKLAGCPADASREALAALIGDVLLDLEEVQDDGDSVSE